MNLAVKWAEVSFHLHATEDVTRVARAIGEALMVRGFEETHLQGHYGNDIIDERATVEGEDAERLLRRVCEGLSSSDKVLLLGELRRHVDDGGTFYIRLDKQQLLSQRMVMAESDSVRMKFKLDAKGDRAYEMVRSCLT
jgi:RNA binding exosome subunit